ncbi:MULTISPECIES: type II toxin-antitoxin system death-on-curing family toxin [unclassified Kitasatospora]|uniref:type II toxin-antitoxin system death-on-curing family toxin n=1 Tax=unclassified Kitasatospora TaxID=2633591 RepID=UPI0027DE9B42|nr:type II toxin-antitoxin system death-on-curing family toxin [Kitasatospora sp. RG8]
MNAAGGTNDVEYLDLEDVTYLAGGPENIRDLGALLSALGRPQASLFGGDAYPDLWTKAAALGQSLARNHPLVDRNKRTAFEAMLLFLDYNDEPYRDPHPDDAVAFMLRLATGGYDESVALAAKDLRSLLGR